MVCKVLHKLHLIPTDLAHRNLYLFADVNEMLAGNRFVSKVTQ